MPISSFTRIVLATLLAAGFSTPVFAQAQPAGQPAPRKEEARPAIPPVPVRTTATYGNWILQCVQLAPTATSGEAAKAAPAVQTCEVVQTVQVQGQSQPIAQVALGRLLSDKALTMTAVLPVNVSLPGLVQVSANGKTGSEDKGLVAMAWQRCVAAGCIATGRPSTTELAAMRAGTEGQLHLVDASGNRVAIPLSWVGLDQAMAALEKMP
jgi:invasion protein IalB